MGVINVELKYTKMQGAGNDFIIIDNRGMKIPVDKLQKIARRVCQRKISVGADGFMVVDNAEGDSDFKMLFLNSDGTIGEMCGNGARCISRYAYLNDIADKKMNFETTSGNVKGEIRDNRLVAVALNVPTLIEFDKTAIVDKEKYMISYVELGYPGLPHGVIEFKGLQNVERNELFSLGKKLRYNDIFKKGANINFYEIQKDNSVVVRTYERGVEDFTLACGTGSASVALVLFLKEIVPKNKVTIKVPGGILNVEIKIDEEKNIKELLLIGDTNIISSGIITDEDLEF